MTRGPTAIAVAVAVLVLFPALVFVLSAPGRSMKPRCWESPPAALAYAKALNANPATFADANWGWDRGAEPHDPPWFCVTAYSQRFGDQGRERLAFRCYEAVPCAPGGAP